MTPESLPSTFYRVSIKALILDDRDRLLIGYMEDEFAAGWEVPGGGWEYGETLEDCLKRELKEEFGAKVKSIGDIKFVYQNVSNKGYPKINLATEVELENFDFHLGEMSDFKFITKDELSNGIDFASDEAAILSKVDQIWPSGKTN